MKKTTKNIVAGSLISAGAAAAVVGYQKMKKTDQNDFLEDTDMRNSKKIDRQESVFADDTEKEEGLTKLDSAYRGEWQANGFPQTHAEQQELEKEQAEIDNNK
ncbi:hypothetical protein [Jeotgalibacillus proteolyticus]|uniref:hypothetical protein n=1 Tax=Jeotgalibacillus proteolyticus TaxID=2082395 RepID=UPI003CF11903